VSPCPRSTSTASRIAPGGAVNILTKTPLARRRTDVSATVGSFDLYRATFDTTGPVDAGKKLLYRTSAAWLDQRSEKAFHHRRQYDLAPALKYVFAPATSLTFRAAYTGKKEVGQPTPPLLTNIGQNQWRFFFQYPRDFNARTDRDWIDSKVRNASLTFDHRLGAAWSLRLVGDTTDSYYNFQRPAVPLTFGTTPQQRPFDRSQRKVWGSRFQANALGQYDLRAAALNVLLGFDRNTGGIDLTRHRSTQQFPYIASDRNTWQHPPIDPASYTDRRDDTNGTNANWGVYAFTQAKVFQQRLLLSAGVRYDEFVSDAVNYIPAVPAATHNKGDNVTPQYGGSFRLFPGVHLYAVYSEAFVPQTGVVNLPDRAGSVAPKPVFGEGSDFGVKIELFDKRALLTLARFELERTNITRNVQVVVGNRIVDEYQVQSGLERSEGVEVGFNARLTRGLQLINNYTYLDAKLVSDVSARAAEGEALADTPQHTYSFFARYDFQSARLRGLFVGAGGNYRGTRDLQVPNGAEAVVPGDWLLDAAAGYTWRRDRVNYSVQANVKNVLNDRVMINLYADDGRTDWTLTFRASF
jgi:iron complex outermembrane recepter protein